MDHADPRHRAPPADRGRATRRVLWVLSGDRSIASSRMQGYNVHRALHALGHDSRILYAPRAKTTRLPFSPAALEAARRALGEGDAVLLQKWKGPEATAVARALREAGCAVYLLDCDTPVAADVAAACDGVVCPSRFLAERYLEAGIAEAHFVPDAPEVLGPRPGSHAACRDGFARRAGWFGIGDGPKWRSVVHLRQLIEGAPGWALTVISNHPDADVAWSDGAYRRIAALDAVLLLELGKADWALVKSANRPLQAMALGVPVLASPLPAYEALIRDGENGFLCRCDEDWLERLRALEDPALRARLALAGWETAQRHAIERLVPRWVEVLGLSATGQARGVAAKPEAEYAALVGALADAAREAPPAR